MQELYEQYRALLFKLAYQLTGSVSDAEDVVQDVFMKAYEIPPEKLTQPKAYLCKMVTNRCRDLQKSARKKREQYFGEWLPEPLVSSYDDGMESVARDELLSYAMIVMLERLTPSERIVFVLREALGFEFPEIAELIEKSEVNCRKLLSRARAKMGVSSEELVQPEAADEKWVHGFLYALKQGNLHEIVSMLDQNVVLVSDGGGKVSAVVKPVASREIVASFLSKPLHKAAIGSIVEITQLNGQPAIIMRSDEGIHTVVMLHVEGDAIRNLYVLRNPDKLQHLAV
ncbi:RNA polymerase sigma factor SigJ [Paenibacillus sp. BC26]|uniref:RNA polymerase sigma factor SigJ n=1 Tax=Paenibacillus sp. BC26 TaxID=1881032 RepID=UPI0008E36A6D|nr:RNA polymerase sigma factor SigJ [Paenibacillus sp. BC26]SFS62608.1 RNA polymerase sigma-70 factor, ECF subfamily [Paenibacillus sp. BC26]